MSSIGKDPSMKSPRYEQQSGTTAPITGLHTVGAPQPEMATATHNVWGQGQSPMGGYTGPWNATYTEHSALVRPYDNSAAQRAEAVRLHCIGNVAEEGIKTAAALGATGAALGTVVGGPAIGTSGGVAGACTGFAIGANKGLQSPACKETFNMPRWPGSPTN